MYQASLEVNQRIANNLGLSVSELENITYEQELSLLKNRGIKPRFVKERQFGIDGRGNPLIVEDCFIVMDDVDKNLDKVLKDVKRKTRGKIFKYFKRV